MLVESDHNQILEKRFGAAGYQVVTVSDDKAAIEHMRHESFETAVHVSGGLLLNQCYRSDF